jgi:predicted DNA-binding ribbon-helix-helix protein
MPAPEADAPPRTAIVKRSLTIAGHRTSVSLEDAFWTALKQIAARDGTSVAGLVAEIDAAREGVNLSSAIRVHVLDRVRAAALGPG